MGTQLTNTSGSAIRIGFASKLEPTAHIIKPPFSITSFEEQEGSFPSVRSPSSLRARSPILSSRHRICPFTSCSYSGGPNVHLFATFAVDHDMSILRLVAAVRPFMPATLTVEFLKFGCGSESPFNTSHRSSMNSGGRQFHMAHPNLPCISLSRLSIWTMSRGTTRYQRWPERSTIFPKLRNAIYARSEDEPCMEG